MAKTVEVEIAGETEYVVLEGSGAGWIVRGTYRASSAERAIRQSVETLMPESGALVAVPSRSWKPVQVTVENKPVVTLKGLS